MDMNRKSVLSNICQVSLVVEDIEAAMDHFVSIGVGPFMVYEVDSRDLPGVVYRGQPADYGVRAAMAHLGPWILELVENVRGKSIYQEFLDEHGPGIHHIGISVDDYEAARNELLGRGYTSIQRGPIEGIERDGWFEYFDTTRDFGACLELLDIPGVLGETGERYPKE
jgi:hypothetical protein